MVLGSDGGPIPSKVEAIDKSHSLAPGREIQEGVSKKA